LTMLIAVAKLLHHVFSFSSYRVLAQYSSVVIAIELRINRWHYVILMDTTFVTYCYVYVYVHLSFWLWCKSILIGRITYKLG